MTENQDRDVWGDPTSGDTVFVPHIGEMTVTGTSFIVGTNIRRVHTVSAYPAMLSRMGVADDALPESTRRTFTFAQWAGFGRKSGSEVVL